MYAVAVTPDVAFAQARWAALTNRERGERITSALRAAGVSAAELARRLALTPQTMSAWTRGEAYADWSRWMSVCLALGLPQTWEPGDPMEPAAEKKVR